MDIKQIAKEIFNLKGKEINRYIKTNKDSIQLLINSTSFLSDNAHILERSYCILNDINEKVKCRECDNHVKWIHRGYRMYCSRYCVNKSILVKEKREKTNIEKYGTECSLRNKKIQEKTKRTMIKKYGVKFPTQNEKIQEKTKQTMVEKYGVEYTFQSKDIREKSKRTLLERYGVEHNWANGELREKTNQINLEKYGFKNPAQDKDIQYKINQTNLERYGVDYPLQSKDIREKSKQTLLERYGVEYTFQSKDIQEIIKKNNIERYGVNHNNQKHNPKAFNLLHNLEWLNDQYVNQLKTATQISLELNIHCSTVCNELNKQGILIRRIGKFSYKAITWLEHIAQKENIFIQHAANKGEYQIPSTRIYVDGYCKETNTIYEFHGDCWHGNPNMFQADEFCHPFDPYITASKLYQKTVVAREKRIKQLGYNLKTIWENEWDNK